MYGAQKEMKHKISCVNNNNILPKSLFLWCIRCVEFEKDDVSILNRVVSSLLSVFPSCLKEIQRKIK